MQFQPRHYQRRLKSKITASEKGAESIERESHGRYVYVSESLYERQAQQTESLVLKEITTYGFSNLLDNAAHLGSYSCARVVFSKPREGGH